MIPELVVATTRRGQPTDARQGQQSQDGTEGHAGKHEQNDGTDHSIHSQPLCWLARRPAAAGVAKVKLHVA